MQNINLLSPYKIGHIALKNRIVMATIRCPRAIGNVPNKLMAEYYGHRAAAGLIITEGASPAPNGFGFNGIPGIYSKAQLEGWKRVTEAVHSKDGKIFVQLMHTGRIIHHENHPTEIFRIGSNGFKPGEQIWTVGHEVQDFPAPNELVTEEIVRMKQDYISAAANAIGAGFDGIELHVANGYLLEQFLYAERNTRNDKYGGCIENRCRFLLEIIEGIRIAIGKNKVGLRFSPYGIADYVHHYQEIEDTYKYLAENLDGILYFHLVDRSLMDTLKVPPGIKKTIRNNFRQPLIFSGGYIMESAEDELQSGHANLFAFSRVFINNPDLIGQFVNGRLLSKDLDIDTFYSPGKKRNSSFPVYAN